MDRTTFLGDEIGQLRSRLCNYPRAIGPEIKISWHLGANLVRRFARNR